MTEVNVTIPSYNKLLVPRAVLFAVTIENGRNGGSFSVTALFATFGWLEPEIGGVRERMRRTQRRFSRSQKTLTSYGQKQRTRHFAKFTEWVIGDCVRGKFLRKCQFALKLLFTYISDWINCSRHRIVSRFYEKKKLQLLFITYPFSFLQCNGRMETFKLHIQIPSFSRHLKSSFFLVYKAILIIF